jgi:tetratricopeptide (TPR) repeat protein
MSETDLQLGGGYIYQWECAILLALNYFFEPVRYNPTLFDLVNNFLGQVAEIHLEGEDRESGVELEDIALVSGDRRILIQVKTKQAEGERWTPTDPLLLKALYRFYDNPFLAEQSDDTRFVFLTNRPFNPDLVRVKSAIKKGTIAQCAEADKLREHLDGYAQEKKKTSIDVGRFPEMLARTALVEYLAVDEVKANVQAKLQAYGRRDWKQAYNLLYEHFSRQSTRVGGSTVIRASVIEVLGPPPEAALPPSLATVALPPRPPDYFVGRRKILDVLKARLAADSARTITALQGMGGIGKTATAQQLALEVQADFPGGIFWADLVANEGNPLPILAAWARLCGHEVGTLPDPQARAQAVRGMLGARLRDRGRLLAVLDDVREGWLEGAQTLKAALPPDVPLVLTTRDEEMAYALSAEVRRLDALPMDDALALLSQLAGAEVVQTKLPEAQALAERVGRLPLALELAGKLAARYARKPSWRLATLRAQVEAKAAEVLKLRGHPGLAATFAVTYEALPAEAQRLFRWLGAFALGPLKVAAVAGVIGLDEKETESALDELVSLAFLDWGETKSTYTIHPLLHEYAQTLLAEAGEADEAEQNHLAHYLAFAQVHAQKEPIAWDRLEEELLNLLLAAKRAVQTKDSTALVSFEEALLHDSEFLYIRGYYREVIDLFSQSLAVQEALGEQQNQPRSLNKLAFFYRLRGQYEKAQKHVEAALSLAVTLEDREQQADSLHYLGIIFEGRGKNELALGYFEEELEIRRKLNDPSRLANCLNSLGATQEFLGNYAEAKRCYNEALTIYNKVGDQSRIAMCIANRGIPSLYLGDYTNAMKDFEAALNQSRELDDREGIAQNLLNRSMVQSYLGDYSLSLQSLEESMSFYQEIGYKAHEALALSTLAQVYNALGDYPRAEEYLKAAEEQIREIGDKAVEVEYLNTLGAIHYEQGNYEGALEVYLQMEALAEETRMKYFLAQSKLGLSRICVARGGKEDLENAQRYAAEAIKLCQELQLASNEPRGHAYLGKANLLLGDQEMALQNCREAMRLLDTQKYVHGSEVEIYLNTIQVLAANDLEDERRQYLERAYEMIQATAAKIEDETLRQSYLDVPVNREILKTWERDCADKTP